jgi:hypothetical protein
MAADSCKHQFCTMKKQQTVFEDIILSTTFFVGFFLLMIKPPNNWGKKGFSLIVDEFMRIIAQKNEILDCIKEFAANTSKHFQTQKLNTSNTQKAVLKKG